MSVSKFLGTISSCCSGSGDNNISERNLNSKIVKFFVGWSDLEVSKKAGFLSFLGGSLTHTFLPSFLGGGRYFQHGFCWFELENGYSYRVEYDRKGYHITQDSFENFEKDCQPKYCFQSVRHLMNPIELIIEEEYSINDILKKCENYTGKNYNLLKNNCQFFVDVFINELKAKRPKGKYGRGNHSASVFGIPYMILEILEKNEKDNSNIIGYIPFLGTVIDSFR